MILITVALNLEFKKKIKYLAVFLILFVLYSVFYARGFFSYFGIAKGTGYSMSFSMPLIFQNLKLYLNLIIPGVPKNLIIPLIFLTFLTFDIYSKGLKSFLFLFSYLILISPVLLFSGRSSGYYNYIPLVFLLTGFGIIFEEILVKISIIKKCYLRNLILVILIIFVFGLFNLNIKAMDNCFLIQYPWKNSSKDAYLGLLRDINDMSKAGKLKKGAEIKLTPDIDYPLEEMESEVIKTFLDNPALMQYTYEYIQKKGVVIIQ
jgi:glucan phosphoethanolaminetransferase (alkaline phosphatase superfamily)